MVTATEREYFKVSEIAQKMGVSEATVVSWIESKELPASDLSTKNAKKRLFRVSKTELESFVARRMTAEKTARTTSVPVARAKTKALDTIAMAKKKAATKKHSRK
jgi:excisionase family DNA binding protein